MTMNIHIHVGGFVKILVQNILTHINEIVSLRFRMRERVLIGPTNGTNTCIGNG
jgi:hypothetical protein